MTAIEGQCRCGYISYRSIDLGRVGYYACHCGQCQKLLGTSYALNLPIRKNMLEITGKLESRDYQSSEERGNRFYFCPKCSSHVFYANSWRKGVLGVRAGTITNLNECEMLGHIWTSSKHDWVVIEADESTFSKSPTEDEWRALFEERNRLYDDS